MGTNEGLPDFFRKRELIYAEQPNAAALSAQGERLLAAGVLEAALESFSRAGDGGGLGKVAAAAAGAGDAFAYEAALKALGKVPTAAEWVALAETALASGRLSFAYRAFEKAESQEGLERVRKEMFNAGIAPPGEPH